MSTFDNPSDQGLTTSQRRFERSMTDHIVCNPGAVLGAVQPDTESRSLSLSLSLSRYLGILATVSEVMMTIC
jgi:hypothetical protein